MYHNILVPVALHDESQDLRAIAVAKALKSENARIILLHVLEEVPAYAASYLPPDQFEKNQKEMKAALDKLADAADCDGPRHVVWGHSGRTILDEADQNRIDCIVMHSHRPALQDYFLGSTAAHVVRHAPCSVHVIR